MNSTYMLTIIVFTYNHYKYIDKCLDSLLNQKTNYLYLIDIWDDCSTDGTSEVCRKYSELFPNLIRYTRQERNTFTNKNVKDVQSYKAFASIKTKYFCTIDGDDFWNNPTKIERAISFLENNDKYIGWAHDTVQIDNFSNKRQSYVHEVLKINEIENPVIFSVSAPFFLTSSRIFRTYNYSNLEILPNDYLVYYYHLSKGPIYYCDEIMSAYVIGNNNTFANLRSKDICNLNSMFAYKLSLLFKFKYDDFCTEMQKKYDTQNSLGLNRYNRLLFLKKIFGIRLGWKIWFIVHFVPLYGWKSMSINYIYNRKKIKKIVDKKNLKHTSLKILVPSSYYRNLLRLYFYLCLRGILFFNEELCKHCSRKIFKHRKKLIRIHLSLSK